MEKGEGSGVKFRLLHISDLHLCLAPSRENFLSLFSKPRYGTLRKGITGKLSMYPTSYEPNLAEGVGRFAFVQAATLDGIVISGDIATTGLSEDLNVAYEFVAAPAKSFLSAKGQPSLSNSNSCIFVLPGNHDRYEDVWGNAGGKLFDQVFANFWGSQHPHVHHRVIEKDGVYLAIIGADFCLRRNCDAFYPEAIYKYGQGRVYSDTIQELKERTKNLRAKYTNVVPIWVVHFLPTEKCDGTLKLIDYQILERQAAQQDVQLILAGHTHESSVYHSALGPRVACAASASCFERDGGNAVHILELDVMENAISSAHRTDFVWSGKAGDFVKQPTSKFL